MNLIPPNKSLENGAISKVCVQNVQFSSLTTNRCCTSNLIRENSNTFELGQNVLGQWWSIRTGLDTCLCISCGRYCLGHITWRKWLT